MECVSCCFCFCLYIGYSILYAHGSLMAMQVLSLRNWGRRSRCAEGKGLVGAVCNVFVAACVVAAATSAVADVAARECFIRHGMGERFHCFGGTLLALLLVCRLGVAYQSDPCAGVFFTLFILTPELQLLPSLDFVVCTCYVPPLPSPLSGCSRKFTAQSHDLVLGRDLRINGVTTPLLFAAPECSSNCYSLGWPLFICASICLRVPLCPPPFGPVAASFLYDLTI